MEEALAFSIQKAASIPELPPLPPGVKPPGLWGTKARLTELFGATAKEIRTTRREFTFRYRSPQHWIQVFRSYYGPLLKAFAALDASAQGRLEKDVIQLIERFNRAQDGSVVVPSAYLEIVITRA